MGRVYRAHQRGIDRDVAVKILHRELSSNTQLVARFHREAKIASKLSHPHVVEVFLVGQLPDGALYMVMEYLDGVSLAGALAAEGTHTKGALPLHRTLAIALQICDAVGEGHARGIVHRDLKPENIMLVRRAEVAEWVKVLDFGIAKLTLGEQSMETQAGLIFGTARYISPEGAQGRQVGPPGDVYAIATMIYQMLAGRTPFDAEPLGLLIKHIHEMPPDLRTLGPHTADIPEPIARVVMDNLAKEPEKRAPTARALAGMLAAAAREANVSFSDVGVVARMSQLPDASHAPSAKKSGSPQLDPTLDDALAMASPNRTAPVILAPPNAPPIVIGPTTPALVPKPAPAAIIRAPSRPDDAEAANAKARPSDRPAKKSLSAPLLLLAFVLGVVLTSVVIFRFIVRPDQERVAYRERTRAALAEGHYVTPPGECVRDLVADGLKRWPDDVDLRQMKSAAEKEMITMAIAARNSGDLVGARNLSRDAFELEGTDNSARYMRAQSEEELEAAMNGTSAKTGAPRLIFESPPVVKPGQPVEMTGKIVWGATPPSAKVTGMKISLNPNGKTTGGTPVALTSSDPSAIRATLTAPTNIGSYDVAFEANVSGTVVRAMRDLDVAP